jgi:hypothetical protein
MKDEEVNLEEIEVSHTLGGYRRSEYYSVVRYTIVNRSHRISWSQGKGLVEGKKHTGFIRDRRTEGCLSSSSSSYLLCVY